MSKRFKKKDKELNRKIFLIMHQIYYKIYFYSLLYLTTLINHEKNYTRYFTEDETFKLTLPNLSNDLTALGLEKFKKNYNRRLNKIII